MLKRTLLALVCAWGFSTQMQQPMTLTVSAEEACKTQEECDALIDDAKDELSNLKDKENQAQEELTEVKKDMGTLIDEIDKTEKSIKDFEQRIEDKELEIKSGEAEVRSLEGDIEELRDVVAERMRVSKRLSHTNLILDILSESKGLVDLVRNLSAINHFADADESQMNELNDLIVKQQQLIATLTVQQEELESTRADLVIEKSDLVALESDLKVQQAALALELQEIESQRLSASEILAVAEEQKEIIKQLEATPPPAPPTSGGSSGGVVSGNFIIPLATGYVSCEYMCYPNHTGIDLANYGNTSTPVLAAASGVVNRAGWHGAYGNHVMITHNVNGKIITTVYAHMHTAPYVSVGQTVSAGQQLGTMGNSGNSFGAHLHFEMYNGAYNYPNAINPRQYISFPSRW